MFSPMRQLAVDVQAGQRLVGVVLRAERRGLAPRRPCGRRRVHQLLQLAVAVVLRALVVEAVADLVADHRADAAVVDRVVGVRIEERRLQDARPGTRSRCSCGL